MAAQISSTDICHHNFLPHLPLIHLSTVNSSPCPGIAPQSLNSTSCTFPGTCIPVRGMYGCDKDFLILIPFRLPQIRCFTLSLKCFSSDSGLPRCRDQTPASVPPPAKGSFRPTNTPVFLPSSFLLQSVAWVYIFFSSGQGLLSTLNWSSACTSVSEGVFLMYLWREMCSMSTHSSAVLFSSNCFSSLSEMPGSSGPQGSCSPLHS